MKKKKPVKITFTVAVIIIELIFLMSMVTVYYIYHVAESKVQDKQNVTNSAETIEDNITIENNKSEKSASKIDWEEYPENDNWINDILKENVEKDSNSYKLTRKTIYSLKNNNKMDTFLDRYYNIFGIGDSTKIIDWTSNYARYCYPNNEKNDLGSKYTKKITYDIAIFNEMYYEGHYDLETCVKNQYNDLVVKKDYKHYDNLPKSFYFEIPNMFIMNGNNESKEKFKNNARVKKIKVTINNEKTYTFELKDTNKVQVFDLGYKQNTIEKPVNIEVEVLGRFNGEKTNDVYISDIQFGVESNIPQGR